MPRIARINNESAHRDMTRIMTTQFWKMLISSVSEGVEMVKLCQNSKALLKSNCSMRMASRFPLPTRMSPVSLSSAVLMLWYSLKPVWKVSRIFAVAKKFTTLSYANFPEPWKENIAELLAESQMMMEELVSSLTQWSGPSSTLERKYHCRGKSWIIWWGKELYNW